LEHLKDHIHNWQQLKNFPQQSAQKWECSDSVLGAEPVKKKGTFCIKVCTVLKETERK
jgi:hypothetical protein